MAQVATDVGTSEVSVGLDVQGAADQFEKLLGEPEEGKKPEPVASQKPAPDADAELDDAVDEAEVDEDADPADAVDPETADAQPKYTVKVDGKELTVPVNELIMGYQRNSDYTQKTQRLAEQRQEHVAEVEAVKTERGKYSVLLTRLDARLQEILPQVPNWEELRATDPVGFASQWAHHNQIQQERAVVQMEQNRLQQQNAIDLQSKTQEYVAAERKLLAGDIPDLADPVKGKVLKQALLEYGLTQGFGEAELSGVDDHRAVVLLHKAWKYDQLMLRRAAAQVKIKEAPAGLPATARGSTTRKVSEVTRAKQTLAKTGRVEDAAALFEQFL